MCKYKILFYLFLFFIIIFILFLHNSKNKETFWILKFKKPINFHYKIKNDIITRLDDKINFYDIFKDKPYFPESYVLNENQNPLWKSKKDDIWFIKHRTSCNGKLVFPVYYKNIKKQFNDILKNNYKHRCGFYGIRAMKSIKAFPFNDYLIQRGIEPLLINSYKSDIRVFFIPILYKNRLDFYLCKDGLVKFSQDEFNKTNLSIKKHKTNTHNCINNGNKMSCLNLTLSEFHNYKKMFVKIISMFKDIAKQIKPLFENDFKSKYIIEYQVCGIDIMFDKNMNLYLIELNAWNPAYIVNEDIKKIKLLKYTIKNIIKKSIQDANENKRLEIDKSEIFIKL